MTPVFNDTIKGRIEQMVSSYGRDQRMYRCLGRLNNSFAYFAFSFTIVATAISSFGAFNHWDSALVGTASLVPGLIALAMTAWKPQDRANWHLEKNSEINILIERLLYQLPLQPTEDNVAAIAKDRAELDRRMNASWKEHFKLVFSGVSTHSRN